MEATPLLNFKSHIEDRNADVAIYSDRIEWTKDGIVRRKIRTEVTPVRAISSVTTDRSGIFTNVVVTVSGNAMRFRVTKAEAANVTDLRTSLVLGHGVPQAHAQPAQAAPQPPPPVTPAGWHPDPHGQAAQRYWDGQQWTEHTA